jgi:hypothetical protein
MQACRWCTGQSTTGDFCSPECRIAAAELPELISRPNEPAPRRLAAPKRPILFGALALLAGGGLYAASLQIGGEAPVKQHRCREISGRPAEDLRLELVTRPAGAVYLEVTSEPRGSVDIIEVRPGVKIQLAEAAAPSALVITDLELGTGPEVRPNQRLWTVYTGWRSDGEVLDSWTNRTSPFSFQLGSGQVIPGWEQGLRGMRVGGKRRLEIPPQLAYGERGAGRRVPPNTTLIFEVELVGAE